MLSRNKDESGASQATEALVPMVDLFAVLAIVFMIYSSEEISENQQKTEEKIQAIVEKVEKDGKKILSQNMDSTLEEIKKQQQVKAQELMKNLQICWLKIKVNLLSSIKTS